MRFKFETVYPEVIPITDMLVVYRRAAIRMAICCGSQIEKVQTFHCAAFSTSRHSTARREHDELIRTVLNMYDHILILEKNKTTV